MPSALGKNLHSCFTKSASPDERDRGRPFYINKYDSLYSYTTTIDPSTSSSSSLYTSLPSDSESDRAQEPDFAAVFASQRFFFSSPGRSNAITDSSAAQKHPPTVAAVKDGVAVCTDSPDPYTDFRRSMQEMVEARGLVDVRANWDYLHELLLCYLALNPKSTHKFIIGAFADLVVTLMSLPTPPPANKSNSREDPSPVVVRFRGGSYSV